MLSEFTTVSAWTIQISLTNNQILLQYIPPSQHLSQACSMDIDYKSQSLGLVNFIKPQPLNWSGSFELDFIPDLVN